MGWEKKKEKYTVYISVSWFVSTVVVELASVGSAGTGTGSAG